MPTLLHVPHGKTHLPGPQGALCGPAIGVQVSGAHPVTCRRCLKLDEINRGQRPGRRYKKTGQKTRQMLLMGGERRNPKRNGSPRNIEHGLAKARYIQQDAQEALLLAAQRRDMRAVQKYADQIERAQAAQVDLERAQSYIGRGMRKRHITPMSYHSMADQAEAGGESGWARPGEASAEPKAPLSPLAIISLHDSCASSRVPPMFSAQLKPQLRQKTSSQAPSSREIASEAPVDVQSGAGQQDMGAA